MPVLSGSHAAGWGPRAQREARVDTCAVSERVVRRPGAGRVVAVRVAGRVATPAAVPRPRERVPARRRPGGEVWPRPAVRTSVSACMVHRPAVGLRWALAVAAAVCAVTIGFGSVVGELAEGAAPAVPEATTVVSVAPGESLWQLAERYAPDANPSAVVARIEELNDISAGEVTAGAVLSVPIARK